MPPRRRTSRRTLRRNRAESENHGSWEDIYVDIPAEKSQILTVFDEGRERLSSGHLRRIARIFRNNGYIPDLYEMDGELELTKGNHKVWILAEIGNNSEITVRHRHRNTGLAVAEILQNYFDTVQGFITEESVNTTVSTRTTRGGRFSRRRSQRNRRRL